MSGSQEKPWSDNLNSPEIRYAVYLNEKVTFAGNLVSSILYGIIVVVFFQCMAALFNSYHRRGGPIKWGIVSYTLLMFSIVTVGTAAQFYVQSISYIDHHELPGVEGALHPGPGGYQRLISHEAISVIQNVTFVLCNWLTDGLLLYRCYVICSASLWVIAFPCLMYLTSLALGIMFVYQSTWVSRRAPSALPCHSITLSLNVLLTFMIITRLILHARNTRAALRIGGIGGLCKAVVTMLVESCALYAITSLLYIGTLAANSSITNFFSFILTQNQVIAPLLIILRVANRSALASNTAAPGRNSEFKARTRQELMGSDDSPPGRDPVSSVDERGMDFGEVMVGVQTTDIDSHQGKI